MVRTLSYFILCFVCTVGSLLFADIDYNGARLLNTFRLGDCVKEIDPQDSRRIQVWSINQFHERGGGGASCGYHALRNGILLAKAVLHPAQSEQYFSDYYSHEHVSALFGYSQSPWRSLISDRRATTGGVWSECVKNLSLIDGSLDGWKREEWEIVRQCKSDVARMLTTQKGIVTEDGQRYSYSFSQDQVMRAFSQELVRKAIPERADGQLHALVSTPEKIRQYVSPQPVNFTVSVDRGDWIDKTEMPRLVEHEKAFGMLFGAPELIVATYGGTIGSVELTDTLLATLNEKEGAPTTRDSFLTEEFCALKKAMSTTQNDILGIVLVYTNYSDSSSNQVSSLIAQVQQKIANIANSFWNSFWGGKTQTDQEKMNAEQTDGHWFTLVVARLRGQTQYLIANSGANYSCLRDSKVNEIIRHFEGRDRVSSSTTQEMTSASTAALYNTATSKVALMSPALLSKPVAVSIPAHLRLSISQPTPAAAGITMTTKLGYTVLAGITLYTGYALVKRYSARTTQRDTSPQTQPQTSIQGNFLV